MAKDRKKLQHIHSSIADKQPTPQSLEVGEIAVNNAEGKEFISLKNSNDKVIRISSDEQMITWTEKKEVIPYTGQVRGQSYTATTKDSHGSVGITNNDLLENKSNIVIKMNQVAANNTSKSGDINGARDIYGNYVNLDVDGQVQGAGISIDMSRYAMIDANPSFSSLTVNNNVNISGNTNIGGDLNVSGNTVFDGEVTFNEPISFDVEDLTVNGDLNVSGKSTFNGDVVFNGTILEASNPSDSGTAANHNVNLSVWYDSTNEINKISAETTPTINVTNLYASNNISGASITLTNAINASQVNSSNGFYQTSDRNFKKDIEDVSYEKSKSARDVIIKQFRYKDDETSRLLYGIIAQDAEFMGLNEIVYTDENGKKSVDYTSLSMLKIAYLENENKELSKKIEELSSKIKELENKIQ